MNFVEYQLQLNDIIQKMMMIPMNEQSHVYPKTPEQSQRLRDAVCHNLLFRTFEAKQIDQILDAMWEKHVQKGEYIIRQGNNLS